MGKTSIEWTDASWNPIVGCTEVSPGCANCYAARLAATRLKNHPDYQGLARILKSEIQFAGVHPHGIPEGSIRPRWTCDVHFLKERLEEPLHWRKLRRIFVCDMGDLFHEAVQNKWINSVWNIMAECKHHTFQVLTKRAARMRQWVSERYGDDLDQDREASGVSFAPLPNVWLGVSVENQHFADERIPLLLQTPAVVRFISAEPLLGAVDLRNSGGGHDYLKEFTTPTGIKIPRAIDWVICGGESGPNARAMHPDWARSLRDQCQAAGVPFFFKQWGEYVAPEQNVCALHSSGEHNYVSDGRTHSPGCLNAKQFVVKVGKKAAGRLLDGRTWSEFPK